MKALVVGRFQPFHLGHLRMLEFVASREDMLVIGIGSANKSNSNDNPFTLEERMEMIRNSVPFENFEFAGIPDFGDDVKWAGWIKENVKFEVVYTNAQNEARIFSGAGFTVMSIPFFDRRMYSAVEIRKRIVEGAEWKSLVPAGTLKVMEKIGGAERIRNLSLLP